MLNTETESIHKLIRNWFALAMGSILLMVITLQFIYLGSDFVPKIIFKILAVIQFSLIIIATIYYLKLRTLKKQLLNTK